MWAANSSSSGIVSVWVAYRLGGSNDGASGFKLRGVVPTAWVDVSSVTQKVGGRVLPDPLSVTAGRVSKGILKLVSIAITRNWCGLGRQAGHRTIGRKLGLYGCKDIFWN